MMNDTERVEILGVGVSVINLAQAVDQLSGWIEAKVKHYVVLCPVYTIMLAQDDPEYRSILNNAGLVTPDGMPLVWMCRILGQPNVSRVYGPDLMLALSEVAAERGYTNYYYGGAEGVADSLRESMQCRFPNLRVIGTCSPPFRPLTADEDQALVDQINHLNPDIIWVGLGTPKQDQWMAEHRHKLHSPLLIGVGAAFDIHSGRIPQAPIWMRSTGLEWLFRLLVEPQRLWRRYLIYNPLFMLQATKQVWQAMRLRRQRTESSKARQNSVVE